MNNQVAGTPIITYFHSTINSIVFHLIFLNNSLWPADSLLRIFWFIVKLKLIRTSTFLQARRSLPLFKSLERKYSHWVLLIPITASPYMNLCVSVRYLKCGANHDHTNYIQAEEEEKGGRLRGDEGAMPICVNFSFSGTLKQTLEEEKMNHIP